MIAEMRKPNGRLRDERRLRSWTQEEAAEALCQLCADNPSARGEVNGKMLSRWEKGENIPSLFYQKKLCSLYAKSPQELGFFNDYTEQVPGETLSTIGERIVIGQMYGREMTSSNSTGGLYALASQSATRLMDAADVDLFAVDDALTLTNSNDFSGWDREDIIVTKSSTPLPIPSDIEAIRQQKLPAIQQNFVNSSHYRLASYTPAYSDRRGLEVTLAPLGFHDYYTLIPFLDELLLTDDQGKPLSIREKYGVGSLTYSDRKASLVPAPVALHCVIVTKDNQIVLMQRSATVAFYPNHWSASFEETMDSPGLSPKRDIRPGDSDFFDCALRGLDEEFGITANEVESVKVLSLNVEYLILAVVPIAVIKVNLTSTQVKSHWMLKAHDKNEATKFAAIPTDLESVVAKLFDPSMLWHPTSRMRLIQFLFHVYGVDAVDRAISQRKTDH